MSDKGDCSCEDIGVLYRWKGGKMSRLLVLPMQQMRVQRDTMAIAAFKRSSKGQLRAATTQQMTCRRKYHSNGICNNSKNTSDTVSASG